MYVCVRVRVCARARSFVRGCVNYSLTLHNVQTRDKLQCMNLAWTITNVILSV